MKPPATWHDELPFFVCPGGPLVWECDGCGGTTWEQRSDRRAVRCKTCGGVEVLPDPASVLADATPEKAEVQP